MSDDPHPMLPGFGPVPAEASESPAPGRPHVELARGPRAVEAVLLEALHGWSERVARDFSLLAEPLRVVVPSRSLRDHLTAAAVRSLGRPLVGVQVQTLYATALELLESAGEPVLTGRELASLWVRRHLRDEPSLMAPLGALTDAHRVVEASVDDLLEAGFGPEHAEALLDALEELDEGSGEAERARAIARIALRVREELDAAGRAHRSQLLERAVDALERDPGLLRTGELWIHGFAEATGRATDLLRALARAYPTTLLVDEPPEPGAPDRPDAGKVFAARLRERFEGAGGRVRFRTDSQPVRPPRALLAAPGHAAEVRAVAGRVRALLDEDPELAPERIAIVGRQLAPYAHALRAHLGRLGVPFSGVGATVATGAGARRAAALSALLEEGEDCGAERWVELLRGLPGWGGDASPGADLRLGLRHLGAGRLADVARLEVPEEDVRLPVRHGLHSPEDDSDARDDSDGRSRRGPTARYRRLRRSVVRAAIERARSLCEQLDKAPSSASAEAWDAWLRDRLRQDLGWGSAECDAATGAGLTSELPAALLLSREEALSLLVGCLHEIETREPIGGRGGGVALLGAMEARARSFDHLFVLGLNRDVFPRPIREDPLLPDSLRRRLVALLPDLPIKATGHDEERYLFAQLLASSPDVVVSWQSASDDGRERVRSTFVDRLCGNAPELAATPVPALHHPSQLHQPGRATARELAIWAGIAAATSDYEAQLSGALREAGVGRDEPEAARVERVAQARASCVREYSRFEAGEAVLGPYMGLIGPASERADLRRAQRYVTSLEGMARCPWRTLLEKLLRLEAPPDPLESFPEIDALTVGLCVHRTLEEMLDPDPVDEQCTPRTLSERLDVEPRVVAWPAPAQIEALAARFAEQQLAAQGHPYPGLARVLAARVVAYVARARELLDAPVISVLGAEVAGSLVVEEEDGRRHPLAFRADLIEKLGDRVRLSDYKTGKVVSKAKKATKRAEAFEQAVARGELLQAVAYALASGGSADIGRYLYLKPSHALETAEVSFAAGTPEAARLEAAFRGAVSTLGGSWDEGVFLPRLSEVARDETPARCSWCDFTSACLHGDTGMRQRQRDHVEAARARQGPPDALESRHLALWDLPAAPGVPETGEEGT